uniref:Uncharacterized protein n=1 Tax=Aquilaria malaccensis TaxID=223753 RepID=A0A4Y6GLS9_9ROSI|nr:hypothetical protein [Aquilaria malaccensis]
MLHKLFYMDTTTINPKQQKAPQKHLYKYQITNFLHRGRIVTSLTS